ncbi:MAG: CPBP family intramembrane glutamic endopeptidase [Promethearchaeota archaeon]
MYRERNVGKKFMPENNNNPQKIRDARLRKLSDLLSMSESIKIDDVTSFLNINRKDLFNFLVDNRLKLKHIKISGEFLDISSEDGREEFINLLDKQFESWQQREEIKEGKDNLTSSKDEVHISKEEILSFCPNCGSKIIWSEELKFCIRCGIYIIPYIPKDQINLWFDRDQPLTDEEINVLYSTTHLPSQYSTKTPSWYPTHRVIIKSWEWKAALGVPLLSFVVQIILTVIVFVIMIFVLFPSLQLDPSNIVIPPQFMDWILFLGYILSFVFLLIPYAMVGHYLPVNATKRDRWNAIGIPVGKMDGKHFLKEVGIGLSFAVLMTAVIIVVQYISGFLTELIYHIPAEQLIGESTEIVPTSLGFFIITIIFMFISIGPSEEVLFRGFCQKGLERSWGKNIALIITAVYFSLFHIFVYFFQPPIFFFFFFPYLSISLMLGFLYKWRDNIIAAIFAHACYNSLQFILAFIFPDLSLDLLSIIIIAGIIGVLVIFAILFRKHHHSGEI